MSVQALAVANYFIDKSLQEPRSFQDLTPMKLLKIIYLAHGLYLSTYKQPLIQESVLAWQYGPVIDSVYHAFKHNGNRLIQEKACDSKGNIYTLDPEADDGKIVRMLNTVWDTCLELTAIQLSNWSHERNSPWDITFNKTSNGQLGRLAIDNKVIQHYFAKAA